MRRVATAVAVATSGGRDSTALLHCTAKAAARLGLKVVALHVHHGLQAQADDWLRHVKRQCQRWDVAFDSRRLLSRPSAGESVEAWARRERYAALMAMAKAAGCDLVLLAHHRRDQAETFLLQALRGGGPAGLAAMPKTTREAGITWARPWLDMPREAIEAYVGRHRLTHIEDHSNNDLRWLRNRMRVRLWPVLLQAFPDAELALSSAASRAQEAAALAAEVATLDMPMVVEAAGLHVPRWLALSQARRLNVLRAWLLRSLGRGSPQTLLQRLMLELPACDAAAAAAGQWDAPGATLHLYRGILSATLSATHKAPKLIAAQAKAKVVQLDLSRPGQVPVPAWQGQWVSTRVKSGGIALALLKQAQLRPRQGGEQFQFSAKQPARSLKKQYQALALPAWQRGGPLLFSAQGQLLFVPGLGIDARAVAPPGAPQLRVSWCADR